MKIYLKNKIPVIISPLICKITAKIFGVPIGGVTLFPFIFVRDEKILNNKDYINHESIHIYQYLETLIFGLIIITSVQYVYARYIKKMPKWEAYYFLSGEQEAHQNDRNHNYLKNRKFGSYYKFLFSKNKKKIIFENGERIIFD
ncbi:MAG: hypothetical protein U0469_01665 [Candidatus Paceibacterota bacterium]|jgi:hypothetical protein